MKLLFTTLILALSLSISAQEKEAPIKEEAKKPTEHFIAELSTNIDKLKSPSCALRLNETTEITLGKHVDVFDKSVFIGQRITITPRGSKKGFNALVTYENLGEPKLDHKTGVATQSKTKHICQILVNNHVHAIQLPAKVRLLIAISHVTASGQIIK